MTHFFLSRKSQDRCLSYCDTLSAVTLTHKDVSAEIKVARALQQGEEILQSVRENGLDELHCEYATEFIDNVRSLIPKTQSRQQDLVENFLNNSTAYAHAINTTLVSSLLSIPLKIEARSAYRTVGLATMFHDIGLAKLPPACQTHDESLMNEKERKLYHTHPELGAQILRGLKHLDASVIQAVLQHHERRHGKGFPFGIKSGNINRIAEVIGIADELVNRLMRETELRRLNPKFEPVAAMEEVFNGFSEPVIEAFRKVFMPKPAKAAAAKPAAKKKSK